MQRSRSGVALLLSGIQLQEFLFQHRVVCLSSSVGSTSGFPGRTVAASLRVGAGTVA